eukprot:CAMPEP_0168313132 /NCGR_PEP_ID=MMETSP0210-20121227/53_1 /TAXON_ID=40633 /ORGANISM="Condylostoma magnum, Strain COL2" /LENGTH=73 /DNA_ID=CAMNT_0008266219 /DNA_START=1382 /DNA_END=1603 /DNA_ORIENTATION=+
MIDEVAVSYFKSLASNLVMDYEDDEEEHHEDLLDESNIKNAGEILNSRKLPVFGICRNPEEYAEIANMDDLLD